MQASIEKTQAAPLPCWWLVFWFTLLPLLLLFVLHFLEVDRRVALELFQPGSRFAMWIRVHSPMATWVIAGSLLLTGVLVRVIPKWRKYRPAVGKVSLQWFLLLAISLGILSEGLGKQYFDRPRPRETVDLAGTQAYQGMFVVQEELGGRSQVSSHMVAALLAAALYFSLASISSAVAATVLVLGLGFAGLVAYARILSGAHFVSDLVLSFWLSMNTGLLLAWLVPKLKRRGKVWLLATTMALLVLVVVQPLYTKLQIWRDFGQQWLAMGTQPQENPSTLDVYQLQAKLHAQGWILQSKRIPSAETMLAGNRLVGRDGLAIRLSMLPAGETFHLALLEANTFDLQMYGRMRVVCDTARVVELEPFARDSVQVRLFSAVVGESGPCPGTPHVFLDSPTPNSIVTDEIRFSGWAFDPAGDIEKVAWLLDGRLMKSLEQSIERPEVSAYFGEEYLRKDRRIGFYQTLPTRGLTAGWHRVELRASNTYGTQKFAHTRLISIIRPGARGKDSR